MAKETRIHGEKLARVRDKQILTIKPSKFNIIFLLKLQTL
ncbi:hypothetical protein PNK_p0129 (plasmid) [Candidatus Protochlamydia naegleriophila]|uniref:Uncharacterized protein n=1 Tax=Candidatus Protochlamydia naegleriophila TaxID=389348 RepID=A0A0U5JJJ1_9BACT|nr:hypothetical protein PNK_p0129 [Candidatus Protochlamydia naegleriophila]